MGIDYHHVRAKREPIVFRVVELPGRQSHWQDHTRQGHHSQAATALGLDPDDFQTSPAYSQPHPGSTWGRERPTTYEKEVAKPYLKDKGRGKDKSKGKGGKDNGKKQDKGKSKARAQERCHNWNRPSRRVFGPLPQRPKQPYS